jgi:hypothetical protein
MVYAQTATPKQPVKETSFAEQTEQLSQQVRAEERKSDFENTGLKWLPFNQAGKSIQDFITKRNKNYRELVGSGQHVDVAVFDIDNNSQPDILLYFWDNCGFQGCLFKVYFDNQNKDPIDFFGWDFIPYKKGVMIDHAYYTL